MSSKAVACRTYLLRSGVSNFTIPALTAQRATARLASQVNHLQPSVVLRQSSSRGLSSAVKMQSPDNNEDFKLENLFNVKNKVAVVSGGGTGIGLMATQGLSLPGLLLWCTARLIKSSFGCQRC